MSEKKPAIIHKGRVIETIEIKGFKRFHISCETLDYDQLQAGSYTKVFFQNGAEKKARTISISKVDQIEGFFALDFVDHSNPGHASEWRKTAKAEDQIEFKDPGPVSKLDPNCDKYFFYADSTGLPAMNAHLEKVEARGENISIFFEGDQSVLKEYCDLGGHQILDSKQSFLKEVLNCQKENSGVWIAGERLEVLELRKALIEIKSDFQSFYISSYWQKEARDEEHRVLKKQDPK